MLTLREKFFAGSAVTTATLGMGVDIVSDSSTLKPVYNATCLPAQKFNNNCTKGVVSSPNSHADQLRPILQPAVKEDKAQPFSILPNREPVDLEFQNLSLTVHLGFRKGNKEILHNVSGKFLGGQLIAIMGPSGAGKSSLLDALSGFKTTGVDGSILLNGRCRDLNAFRRMSCYITQDDRLHSLLTVNESMHLAADLKLGKNISYDRKDEIVEDILILLGLSEHNQTLTKRLSGGQKKRLSIAMELINNPTVMFLDEPTTGLDSSSCSKVLELCKNLAQQGRTIICTIHQPTAKLFQIFDQVYVLAAGNCIYQGSSYKLVPFLRTVDLPCPVYHNPADYIIELACGEYGQDKVNKLKLASENGSCKAWFEHPEKIPRAEELIRKHRTTRKPKKSSLEDTSFTNQLAVLLHRGYIKAKRDTTLTHLRIGVNVFVAVMLSALYLGAGREGSRVLDNYNLLFAILIHHSMTSMMLTVLTCIWNRHTFESVLADHLIPYTHSTWQLGLRFYIKIIGREISVLKMVQSDTNFAPSLTKPMNWLRLTKIATFPMEMSILLKEHFNRWYSLKAYYTAITLVDLPISILGSLLFSSIIYYWSHQPMEWLRFWMFFSISTLIVLVGQSFGLMIGAWFDVVNGTFLAPVLTIPMMMFAGFGVTLRDLPSYLKWGSHISYLRYGLEGFVGCIYGKNRGVLECEEAPYCHYRYPKKFLDEITMSGDQFWFDVIALSVTIVMFRLISYLVLKAKIKCVK